MHRKIGVAVGIIGLLMGLLGAATMIVLGPDSQITTGPHNVDSRDSVAVTSPKVFSWRGVKVTVTADVPAKKPIFIGLGRQRDTDDYVSTVNRTELKRAAEPWSSHIKHRKGDEDYLAAAPTAVDWWLDSSTGIGGARVEMTLPDEPVQVVITSLGSSNLSGMKVRVGYGIAGGFASGAGVFLLGLGLMFWGWLLWRERPMRWRTWRAWRRKRPSHEQAGDVVMYVYVDDDGVEHEVDEEQAAELGLFDDDVEIVDETGAGEASREGASGIDDDTEKR